MVKRKENEPPPEPAHVQDRLAPPRLIYPLTIIAVVIFASVLYFPIVNRTLYFHGGDNAKYLSLAKALAAGRGYTNIDSYPETPHTKYPPLFPALMALIILGFGENILLMKMLIAVTAVLTAVFWCAYLKESGEYRLALPAALLTAAAPFTLYYSRRLLTDIPFTFFCLAALYFFIRSEKRSSLKQVDIFPALIFMLSAYFMRSAGIALVLAILPAVILSKEKRLRKDKVMRTAIFAAAGILAVFLWNLRNYLLQRKGLTSTYISEFFYRDPYDPGLGKITLVDLIHRFSDNTGQYFRYLSSGLVWPPTGHEKLALAVTSFFVILVIFGLVIRFRKKRESAEWFFLSYLGLILVWPYTEIRFLNPLFPFLIFYFLKGIEFSVEIVCRGRLRLKSRLAKSGIIIAVTAVFLALNLNYYCEIIRSIRAEKDLPTFRLNSYFEVKASSTGMARMVAVNFYLRKHTEPSAVIASRKPMLSAVVSNRRTVPFPFDSDPTGMKDRLLESKADYVIYDEVYHETYKYLLPAITKHPENFQPVLHVPQSGTYLFKILPTH